MCGSCTIRLLLCPSADCPRKHAEGRVLFQAGRFASACSSRALCTSGVVRDADVSLKLMQIPFPLSGHNLQEVVYLLPNKKEPGQI